MRTWMKHTGEGLHLAAGPGLTKECVTLGGCRIGMIKVTNAYDLSAWRIIHTIGHKYAIKYHTTAENSLSHYYRSCLELLIENGLRRVSEKMAEPVVRENNEELSLLPHQSNGDRSWWLNFDGFQLFLEHKDNKPFRSLYGCFGVLGPKDNVVEYYQQQVKMLEGFNEMNALAERDFILGMSKKEQEKLARSETLAIRIFDIANMILFAAKVYAFVKSGPLAIIASTLDSLLDLLSGFILWFTAFSMSTPNSYRYLIGKKRMQPLGIFVFTSVVATLGLQIILESLRTMVSDEDEFNLTREQERWVVGIMLGVTLVKLLMVFYCRTSLHQIDVSSSMLLRSPKFFYCPPTAMDHRPFFPSLGRLF